MPAKIHFSKNKSGLLVKKKWAEVFYAGNNSTKKWLIFCWQKFILVTFLAICPLLKTKVATLRAFIYAGFESFCPLSHFFLLLRKKIKNNKNSIIFTNIIIVRKKSGLLTTFLPAKNICGVFMMILRKGISD